MLRVPSHVRLRFGVGGGEDPGRAPGHLHQRHRGVDDALGKSSEGIRDGARACTSERSGLSTLALYEWRRGRRTDAELAHQEALLPEAQAVPFGPREAVLAAELYRLVSRRRQREFALGGAACALVHDAVVLAGMVRGSVRNRIVVV